MLWCAVGGTHLPTHLLVTTENTINLPHREGVIFLSAMLKNLDPDMSFFFFHSMTPHFFFFYLQQKSNIEPCVVCLTLRHKPAGHVWDSKGISNIISDLCLVPLLGNSIGFTCWITQWAGTVCCVLYVYFI